MTLCLFADKNDPYSIYVRNMPYEANESSVRATFQKFGAIQQGGIRLNHRVCSKLFYYLCHLK